MNSTAPIAILATAVITASACTRGGSLPRPVPENATHPIAFEVRGATPPEIIEAVTDALGGLGISLLQIRKSRGYAETTWLDVGNYVQSYRGAYPAEELIVQYQIAATETDRPRVRRVEILGVYRPYPLDRARQNDRPIPTDHPGYQLALRIEDRLRLSLIERNAQILEVDPKAENGEKEGARG